MTSDVDVRRVVVPSSKAPGRSLKYVRDTLERTGSPFDEISIDEDRLRLSDRQGRMEEMAFRHTPEPLIRSWRCARQLMRATNPGDEVLVSDHAGLAGVFALAQASLPEDQRRLVWTVAADSLYLELRFVAAAHTGLPEPWESTVDWEIVQYRYSQHILATSPMAVSELRRIGIEAELVTTQAELAVAESPPHDARRWWVPGPVSRRNQTGEILRALASSPGARAAVSREDADDEIWSGASWAALRHVRAVLADRLERVDRPNSKPDVVVLGDPYDMPDHLTEDLAQQGVPIVVPDLSAASVLFPGAAKWAGADDLASRLSGNGGLETEYTDVPSPRVSERVVSAAERISIGVPIFRDVRFLDECLDSLLAQSQEPFEIMLIDDGSAEEDVDEAIEKWTALDSRIRGLRVQHRGVCVARNRALDEMSGDAFVFVDSDDRLDPAFLARCAGALRIHDSLWGVATWTRFVGAYEGVEAKPPFDRRVGLRENPIVSTTVLVDMAVRDRGIRFQPDLAFLYCEDWHFWSQIVAAGGRIGLVPEALAHHRVHKASGGHMRTELAHSLGKTRATAPLKN